MANYIQLMKKSFYLKALIDKTATTEEVARMQVATGCCMIETNEYDYEIRVEEAEKSYNTIRINPIDQIKMLINKLFSKK